MRELKQLNDKLFYSIAVRKDKFKKPVSITITIASAITFAGFIIIKLTRQLKFARTIKKSTLEEKYVDTYFTSIIQSIREITEVEDLVLYLISIGFYDILKKIDFLSEMSSKFKLLKE